MGSPRRTACVSPSMFQSAHTMSQIVTIGAGPRNRDWDGGPRWWGSGWGYRRGVTVNCPFCQGIIPDLALGCLRCTRDVAFVRPFVRELAAIHKRLDDLDRDVKTLKKTATLGAGPAMATGSGQLRVRGPRLRRFVDLGMTMDFAWDADGPTQSFATFRGAMLVLTFPPGRWYGRRPAGRRTLAPMKLGAAIAFVGR